MVAGMSVTQRASHAWGVWSGVVSATLFVDILTDCRPPVASSRELGVGAISFPEPAGSAGGGELNVH